jgi:exodeoxyribonuclease VII large subunit
VAAFDLRGRARGWRVKLERQSAGLRVALDRAVIVKRRRLNSAQMQFASLDLRGRVGKLRRQLERGTAELTVRMDRLLVARRRRWEGCNLKLRERSPYELLKRGYAIVYDATGQVVRSVDEVSVGDAIGVRLARGQIDATVRGKKAAP